MIKLFGKNSSILGIKKKSDELENKVTELNTAVVSIIPTVPTSDSGKVSIGTMRNGCSGSTTVTFSKPFATIPTTITATATCIYYGNTYKCKVTITQKSRAGFVAVIANGVGKDVESTVLTWSATV